MKTKPISYLFLIICVSFSGALFAQKNLEKKITIAELFSLTLENNPTLSVSKANVKIAEQDVKVAGKLHRNLRAGERNLRKDHVDLGRFDVALLRSALVSSEFGDSGSSSLDY